MLVITRTEGQRLKLYRPNGDDLAELVFFRIEHGRLKVGIEAAPDIRILRAELGPPECDDPPPDPDDWPRAA